MGSRHNDETGPDEAPEGWRGATVPDDPAELAELSATVRAELEAARRKARRERRLPYIVLAIAVGVTLLSMIVTFWLLRLDASRQGEPNGDATQVTQTLAETSSQARAAPHCCV